MTEMKMPRPVCVLVCACVCLLRRLCWNFANVQKQLSGRREKKKLKSIFINWIESFRAVENWPVRRHVYRNGPGAKVP